MRQQKNIQTWESECTRLKDEYIQALGNELTTGFEEDKDDTALRKREYDQRLKMLRKQKTSAYESSAEIKSKSLWQTINKCKNPNQHQLIILNFKQ